MNVLVSCSCAFFCDFPLRSRRNSKWAVSPCSYIITHPKNSSSSRKQTLIDDTSASSELELLKEKLGVRNAFVPFNSLALSSDLRFSFHERCSNVIFRLCIYVTCNYSSLYDSKSLPYPRCVSYCFPLL
jgi:hypothetical protein